MHKIKIEEVVELAEELIALGREAINELELDGGQRYLVGTKTSGALRRRSLDLTRALAELRRS